MSKRVVLTVDDDARAKVIAGVKKSADILARTLGNKGRNVALDTDKYRLPLLTNDGISILRQLHFEDPAEELGVKLVRQAASKTEDHAGDGTTTTTILMNALLEGIAKSDKDPLELRAEIEADVNELVKYIQREAKPAKSADVLAKAATISCRDPKIGKLIAEVVAKAKDDGMITLEDNLAGKTEVVELEGLQLRTGYAAKQFVNQPAVDQVVVTNPAFVIGNMPLNDAGQYAYIAEKAMLNQRNVVVVIAQDIGTEFMMYSYINWLDPKAPCKILPVRVNQQADIADGMVRDIAAVTGAHFIDTLLGEGLEWLDQAHEGGFGVAKKFVQGKKESTVMATNKNLLQQRADELKREFAHAQDFQAENIKERIARLKSACFTIRVGGATETELLERKTRVQDALNTARAAYDKGVVKGGGLTLVEAAAHLKMGAIAQIPCNEPAAQLARNNNVSKGDWLRKLNKNDDVWDSAVAVIEALINASSQAIQIMLTEAVIIDPEVNL